METEDQKEFKQLYEEYKKLMISTHIQTQIVRPGQPYNVNYIKLDELMRRKALAKELVKKYKKYFEGKPSEWFDLESDTLQRCYCQRCKYP